MSELPGQSGHALPDQRRQVSAISRPEQMQQVNGVSASFDHVVGAGE
jgi:hypothetical protein